LSGASAFPGSRAPRNSFPLARKASSIDIAVFPWARDMFFL
jgi:hypothetical protein